VRVCGCDNRSSSLSLGYNNNLSKAATVAITYHAARIIYRSSQILDSNTMQHGGLKLTEKKNHTHIRQQHGQRQHKTRQQERSSERRWTPGSTRSSTGCRRRCGLAAFTGDGSTYSDDGGVEWCVSYGPYTLLHRVKGDSDVISSYELFSGMLWGKLCEKFDILTSVDVTFSIR